jgi:hypothetical protein
MLTIRALKLVLKPTAALVGRACLAPVHTNMQAPLALAPDDLTCCLPMCCRDPLQLKEVRWAEVPKPDGACLRVTRFVNASDKVVLSVVLHQPGEQEVEAWRGVRERYGDTVVLQPQPS